MRALLLGLLLAFPAVAAFAQQPPQDPQPPPEIDDPGVEAVQRAARTPRAEGEAPLPEKVPGEPGGPEPTVTIRQEGTDIVEEYRNDGQLYMVRVTPRDGPTYMLLDTNGDGRLDSRDSDAPVNPVYWTIYEWD